MLGVITHTLRFEAKVKSHVNDYSLISQSLRFNLLPISIPAVSDDDHLLLKTDACMWWKQYKLLVSSTVSHFALCINNMALMKDEQLIFYQAGANLNLVNTI